MEIKDIESCVSPKKIVHNFSNNVMLNKTKYGKIKTLMLGIAAGAMISFGAQGSLIATTGTYAISFGLAKLLAGIVFSTGLMMIVLTGAELFTGNVLICFSLLEKKTTLQKLLRNWGLVYLGNIVGALIVSGLIYISSSYHGPNEALGVLSLKVACGKVSLTPIQAFTSGILCNWLVCLAVWMAMAAKDVSGKILAIVFPITTFVMAGYEHCVANMFFLSNGYFIKHSAIVAEASGLSVEQLANLNLMTFIFDSFIPVTLGNIVGAFLFVVCIFWVAYIRKD